MTAASGPALARRSAAEKIAGPLPPLLVAADRVAATVAQGVHGRRRVGLGEAFWQYRAFGYGDSPQRIDWRRSARSDRLYVRENEWEAAQSVWVWCDASASMHYASAASLSAKWDRAAVLTLALLSLLSRGGERIALLDQPEPPAIGRAVMDRITMTIADAEHSADNPDLPPAPSLPRFATVVLISDFLAPPDKLEAVLRHFAARGVTGHLLQILDPAEAEMPFRGRSRFLGLEREGDMLVGRAESIREDYLRRLDALQEELESFARTAGWSFAAHRTDTPPEPALLSLYLAMADRYGS